MSEIPLELTEAELAWIEWECSEHGSIVDAPKGKDVVAWCPCGRPLVKPPGRDEALEDAMEDEDERR